VVACRSHEEAECNYDLVTFLHSSLLAMCTFLFFPSQFKQLNVWYLQDIYIYKYKDALENLMSTSPTYHQTLVTRCQWWWNYGIDGRCYQHCHIA
jgi:hypothetical protein